MAPIFYCTCTNCICTATVLLTQDRQEMQPDRQDGQEAGEVEGQYNDTGQGQGQMKHQFGDEGHQEEHRRVLPPGGKEYTYLVSGWDRSTDVPLVPPAVQMEDDSGAQDIFLMVVFVLILIGKHSHR